MKSPITLPFACRVCAARWGGLNTSHCMRCHATFSTVANFDRHQRGGECLEPAEVGLVLNGRSYACWGQPGDQNRPASVQGQESARSSAPTGL